MARVLLQELRFDSPEARLSAFDLDLPDLGRAAVHVDDARLVPRLVRSLAGLTPLDGGKVTVGRQDVTTLAPHKRSVAVVFAGGALFDHLDVRGNIDVGLRWRGVPARTRAGRTNEVAALVGLEDRLRAPVSSLSEGDRVRVGLARALVRAAGLVVFEDVFSAAPPEERSRLRADIIAALKAAGRTALLVTTSREDAIVFGDHIAVVSEGRLQETAPPQTLSLWPESLAGARIGGAAVLTPERWASTVTVGGKPVRFGPDRADVVFALPLDALTLPAGEGLVVTGRVEEVVFGTGSDLSVILRIGDAHASFRWSTLERPAVGSAVAVAINPARVAIFEVTTGRRHVAGPKPAAPTAPPPVLAGTG
ncbi:MAG: sn-glycerol-3-phosphate import ATP-binding protein UgpC [Pseudomonadota bacterium]|jgi:ABC-type Fe3+/spermidine/putrescine transport system ATPase subunit